MTFADRLQGLILAGLGLGIPVAVAGSFFTDARALDGDRPLMGYSAFATGCIFALLNFYLSWLRPLLHRLRSDGTELHHISGVPLLGNVAVLGLLFAPPSVALSTAALLQIVLDTGGLQHFVRAVWKEMVWGG
jgi:hypothetical protein